MPILAINLYDIKSNSINSTRNSHVAMSSKIVSKANPSFEGRRLDKLIKIYKRLLRRENPPVATK